MSWCAVPRARVATAGLIVLRPHHGLINTPDWQHAVVQLVKQSSHLCRHPVGSHPKYLNKPYHI